MYGTREQAGRAPFSSSDAINSEIGRTILAALRPSAWAIPAGGVPVLGQSG